MPVPKLVLAYSGGLDTTTAIKWLSVEQGYEVVALNIDVGMSREQPVVESRGMAAGALKVRIIDAKEDFIRYFAFPALAAGAMYQDAYPLATAATVPDDAAKAAAAAKDADTCSAPKDCYNKAALALQAKDNVKAMKFLPGACDHDSKACVIAAEILAQGKGLPADVPKAADFYKRARARE